MTVRSDFLFEDAAIILQAADRITSYNVCYTKLLRLSDRELTDRILGTGAAQQSVNAACRQLVCSGRIGRTAPPIKNYVLMDKDTNTHPIKTDDMTQRGQYLKSEFNSFWSAFWKTEKDYYSTFTLGELVKLKLAITNINNLITFESTIIV